MSYDPFSLVNEIVAVVAVANTYLRFATREKMVSWFDGRANVNDG
jgi:hypothetical protein